jgi:hypothetical protein
MIKMRILRGVLLLLPLATAFRWPFSQKPISSVAPTSSNSDLPKFTFDELFKLQTNFLDNFIYPANVEQAKAINSTLLAEDAQGRVDSKLIPSSI